MNIFQALSQGDGSISETNVTSFLSFLLNNKFEFSASLFLLFIELVSENLESNLFNTVLSIKGNSYRQKINDFKSKYNFSSIPEYKIRGEEKSLDIDILISISDKRNENDLCYLLIENKVKRASYKKNQCLDQFNLFKEDEDFQENVPLISILISPNIQIFNNMVEAIKPINRNAVWLKWYSEEEKSVINIFKKLLILENNAEVSPIESGTKYIIKSFIEFMSGILNPSTGDRNISIAGSSILEECEYEIDNEIYKLKRFDNRMIRIFNSKDERLDIQVKPVLRKIIKEYNLSVDLMRVPGEPKNTQILGRDVIREINKGR